MAQQVRGEIPAIQVVWVFEKTGNGFRYVPGRLAKYSQVLQDNSVCQHESKDGIPIPGGFRIIRCSLCYKPLQVQDKYNNVVRGYDE